MGIFKKPAAVRPVDEHLTYFTPVEADDFRRIVGRSFATVGRDVSVYPDHVEDRGGTTFGLWNIGALCAGVEPSDWPGLIDEHVRLVTTPPKELDDLTPELLESSLYLRLVEAGSVRDPDELAYARVVSPGLLEVLAVDVPDAVVTPTREELSGRGTLGAMVDQGRENLRALLASRSVHSETVGTGASYTVVTGESFFTASLALVLPDAVEHFTGQNEYGWGVLVAVPHRRQLLYRSIDAPDAALALRSMLRAAFGGYRNEPGPLSPNVYWVRNNRWVQVTSFESGKPKVVLDGGLKEALKSV